MEQFGGIKFSQQALADLQTPCYVVSKTQLERNLLLLQHVQQQAGCKILLAFKGFAMWNLAPLVRKYLPGTSASSVNEARLGREVYGGELHVYAPAFSDADMAEHLALADHIVFNSPGQYKRFKALLEKHDSIKAGIRINPEHSEADTPLYDPSGRYSRLGTTLENLKNHLDHLEGISGLHFHNLCEQNVDALERTLAVVEDKFGFLLQRLSWINFGGGHHISRSDYQVDRLIQLIKDFKRRHALEVYLEPGEAIALNTGVLVTTVEDVIINEKSIALLDTSVTAHMPDVLEMPYRPLILNADEPNRKKYTYRLGGVSCLAGDVVGDYSFDDELKVGDRLIFGDMAHYTMVKNTTFNGVRLPSMYIYDEEADQCRLVKHFTYEDYKNRLS
ncbi:carboxynorspermidine decarboxylase [Saccharicrinis fermentans]|uniref:Carboxynorspermidine/carboxyspermidine decarboxylase n=1 Tax=Saccharicrinis fermentans DSM 9555 = JCM 21142 TaxID=869213 RepID=W7XVQ6_9BACT|nr:carboxynorspermidine decarboxylase [Saccharicrinis fermentans]GAF02270.1 diaminopimelate decarboxylase [Saccharicrinis fermentans DSM 9555 = JCM 21142]